MSNWSQGYHLSRAYESKQINKRLVSKLVAAELKLGCIISLCCHCCKTYLWWVAREGTKPKNTKQTPKTPPHTHERERDINDYFIDCLLLLSIKPTNTEKANCIAAVGFNPHLPPPSSFSLLSLSLPHTHILIPLIEGFKGNKHILQYYCLRSLNSQSLLNNQDFCSPSSSSSSSLFYFSVSGFIMDHHQMSPWLGFSLSPVAAAASSTGGAGAVPNQNEGFSTHHHYHHHHNPSSPPLAVMPLRSDGSICFLDPHFRPPPHHNHDHSSTSSGIHWSWMSKRIKDCLFPHSTTFGIILLSVLVCLGC